MTRRELMSGAAGAVAGLSMASRLAAQSAPAAGHQWKYSMCDWMLGVQDPSAFERGKAIGLDAVQVSIGFPENGLQLRKPEIQQKYLGSAKKNGMVINSVAMGLLNDYPMMSEPKTALWAADTIEATKAVGAKNILLAFFNKGELKAENKEDMRRVTEVLQELAPRAEKAQVILGIESYLTAEAHLEIIDRVKNKWVQVYYDVYNANHEGHDYLKEIHLLGGERICEVHFKEGGDYLGAGKIKWPEVVAALKEVGYRGYVTLETGSPKRKVVEDTQKNLVYLKGLFG